MSVPEMLGALVMLVVMAFVMTGSALMVIAMHQNATAPSTSQKIRCYSLATIGILLYVALVYATLPHFLT